VGENIFTIYKKNSKIKKIEISYNRPKDAPGWKIRENSKLMIDETTNRGESGSSKNVTYTYTIPDSPIKLDDTVNETWFEWTGNETDNGYFDASKMENNWVNVNGKTGSAATLKGAGQIYSSDLTLEQCKSECEKEDECKAVEFTEKYGDWETSCALTKVKPTEDNTTTTELERKIWIRPDKPAGPPATDADASPDTTWEIYNGTRFKGTPGGTDGTWAEGIIETFENATLNKCKYECEKRPQCKSFNYHTQESDKGNNCHTFLSEPRTYNETASNIKGPHPHDDYSDWQIYEQTSDKIVPDGALPDEIYMKGGKSGKWCGWGNTYPSMNHRFSCDKDEGDRRKIKLINSGDGTYSFKGGPNGKYGTDAGGNNIYFSSGTTGGNTKFEINKNSDGTYSIKGPDKGKYCKDDGVHFKCQSDDITSEESFYFEDMEGNDMEGNAPPPPPTPPTPPPPSITEIPTGEKVYIKGGNKGKYCKADKKKKVYCNTTTNANGIDDRLNFIFNKNSDGTYSFKNSDSGGYCTDLANYIQCSYTNIRDWQKFKIINNSDGTYSLMGNGGKGPAADGGLNWKYCRDEQSKIKCNRGSIGIDGWEKFEIGKI